MLLLICVYLSSVVSNSSNHRRFALVFGRLPESSRPPRIAPLPPSVRYLVFDTESAADGALVSKLRYPGEGLKPKARRRSVPCGTHGEVRQRFIPYTFQLPVSVAVAKVAADYRLIDLVTLDEPQFRPHVLTEHFWRGWEK